MGPTRRHLLITLVPFHPRRPDDDPAKDRGRKQGPVIQGQRIALPEVQIDPLQQRRG